jgi:hypothetical protein
VDVIADVNASDTATEKEEEEVEVGTMVVTFS